MSPVVGLIPAAGRGVRAYPYTATIPKSMLEIDGVPVLRRNVELLRDQLGIRDIRIVVGYQGQAIRRAFGDGAGLGVRITYVHNPRLDLELPYSVYLAGREISAPCCMILADECYVDSNHHELRAHLDDGAVARCGVITAESAKQIRKNYTVTLQDDRIVDLIEKPATVSGPLMGTGTYLLQPEIFRRLGDDFADPARRPKDWTSWLAGLARGGALIRPFYLTGEYVNVNSRDDLSYANYLVRSRTFDERTTSLVYVIDDHEDAADRALQQFVSVPDIDEVVAVARRDTPALARAAGNAKIRVVTPDDPAAPVGHLVTLGLDQARGTVLLLAYSDDTFALRDVAKILVYLRDADMVVGTRTTRQMIEQGANMRGIVRAAHIILAKLAQLLWWRFESRFTDICCVYRGLWRSTYRTIRANLSATGSEVFPELTIEALRARLRIIEIPIHYYNRDLGHARVRGKYQSVSTFMRVMLMLLRKRWQESRLGAWLSRWGAADPPASGLDASSDTAEMEHYRHLERQWQDEVGAALLEQGNDVPGSLVVFDRQRDRLVRRLDPQVPGPVIDVGCGQGHLLGRVQAIGNGPPRLLVGVDVSRAVNGLPGKGMAGVRGDGEFLPFRDESVAHVLYDGALHHVIRYPQAVREAMRVLVPGGSLVIFEPTTSGFTQLIHRVLDPIVFSRSGVYESPIDIRYKAAFRREVIVDVLRQDTPRLEEGWSDFLAYPFTGCYAGSVFARSERLMRWLIRLEDAVMARPWMARPARFFAWRFTIVATKDTRLAVPDRRLTGSE